MVTRLKKLAPTTPDRAAAFVFVICFVWSMSWFYLSDKVISAYRLNEVLGSTDLDDWAAAFVNAGLFYFVVRYLARRVQRTEKEKRISEAFLE